MPLFFSYSILFDISLFFAYLEKRWWGVILGRGMSQQTWWRVTVRAMYCLTGPWGDGEQQAPLLRAAPLLLQLPSRRRRSEVSLLPVAANITQQTHPQVSCSGRHSSWGTSKIAASGLRDSEQPACFCLLSWDDTSRPWIPAGAWGPVLLSHRPSLQSSMLSSAVCNGRATQVCCPNKAPVKCKHCHWRIPPQNFYRESYVQIKPARQRNIFETLYFSSCKAISSFQLFPHTSSLSRMGYNTPDEMSKSSPCIQHAQQ